MNKQFNNMMSKAMNESMKSVLTKVALGEKLTSEELFKLQALYGSVEDKDQTSEENIRTEDLPSEDESIYWNEDDAYLEGWATIANLDQEYNRLIKALKMACRKGVKYSRKNHLKDKARHGYHRGSVNGGWETYDRWLLEGRSQKEVNRDFKAQMQDMDIESSIPSSEKLSEELTMVFNMDIHGMKVVYYHYGEDFAKLGKWNHRVRSWMEQSFKAMPSEGEVYSYLENTYPEMGMNDMKSLVEGFIGYWKTGILMEGGAMWRYCQRSYQDYYQEIQDDLDLEFSKLEDLTKKLRAAKAEEVTDFFAYYPVAVSKIQELKQILEEMDKANAKYI